MRVGVDIMGGDYAPDATVGGAVLAREVMPKEISLVLIGNKDKIIPLLKAKGKSENDFEIVHTTEVIEMGDNPVKGFSQKHDSSIRVGFKMLKERTLDGFASAGNSGALMVGAMLTVKTIPGVIRPSITSILPKEDGTKGLILDVGINADCKPDVLYQFGVLGSIFAEYVYGIKNPKVALLNIGEESEKGNLAAQAAHELMKDSKDFNFAGNVEGRDLFNGKSDVIVCDGFTGNVVLKTAEAIYSLIKKRGRSDAYFDTYNYEIYGGTPILGINSTVIIGHGISNETAVKNMILLTKDVVEAKISEKIRFAFN